ncbi:MAG: hypothetical protein BIFFINMI_00051 [Phycisphaerae bacterium]|nr:hypothetical protein [Phycisphaerae bacterium]
MIATKEAAMAEQTQILPSDLARTLEGLTARIVAIRDSL